MKSSVQAANAASLILLAQTRRADRDKEHSARDIKHREDLAAGFLQRQDLVAQQNVDLKELLELNTRLTKQIDRLTAEIHQHVVSAGPGSSTN